MGHVCLDNCKFKYDNLAGSGLTISSLICVKVHRLLFTLFLPDNLLLLLTISCELLT